MSAPDSTSQPFDHQDSTVESPGAPSGLVGLYARRMEVVAESRAALMNGNLAASFVTVPFGRPLVEPATNEPEPAIEAEQPVSNPWEALRRRLSAPATPQGKLATT